MLRVTLYIDDASGNQIVETGSWTNFMFRPGEAKIDALYEAYGRSFGPEPSSLTAKSICEAANESCQGQDAVYSNVSECQEYMSSLEEKQLGCNYEFAGETRVCKFLHTVLAQDNPSMHCPHLSRRGGPDPKGNYKCQPSHCYEASPLFNDPRFTPTPELMVVLAGA